MPKLSLVLVLLLTAVAVAEPIRQDLTDLGVSLRVPPDWVLMKEETGWRLYHPENPHMEMRFERLKSEQLSAKEAMLTEFSNSKRELEGLRGHRQQLLSQKKVKVGNGYGYLIEEQLDVPATPWKGTRFRAAFPLKQDYLMVTGVARTLTGEEKQSSTSARQGLVFLRMVMNGIKF